MVFASGRPPMVATEAIDATRGAVHYGVMANGSIVCTLPDVEVLRTIGFPAATAVDAVITLRRHDARFGFALATDRGLTKQPGFDERMPVHGQQAPVDDVLTGHEGAVEAFKLLVFHHDHDAMWLLDNLPPLLGDQLAVTHMGAEAVEVGPAGADKGAGLQWLCDRLGVPGDDVMVIGDEVNDLAMFAVAGTTVAVANASPLVLEAAHHVTASNADDGVAVFLERLLKLS